MFDKHFITVVIAAFLLVGLVVGWFAGWTAGLITLGVFIVMGVAVFVLALAQGMGR